MAIVVRGKRVLRRLVAGQWDLQAKIVLVLIGVIVPTYIVVTFAQNKLTQPILEEEMRQIGINSGKTLAAEIVTGKMLVVSPVTNSVVESKLQEVLYAQPNILRIDVVAKDPISGQLKTIASNIIEEDPSTPPPLTALSDTVTSDLKEDESGVHVWEISVPIEAKSRDPRGPRRLLGNVHVVVSLKLVEQIVDTLWRTTASAAGASVVTLLLVLSYFLRKTIANDRLLRQAESANLQLTEQLHETERELMTREKLAVMGQLTASFAHEIGTPLNAIGGHLQLLKEDLPPENAASERLEVINGQVSKIEEIVKGFLQSTSKPNSQRQLVDVNRLVDKTIGIVRPRIDSLRVEVRRDFDRELGPIRMVPLELEQVLLNLLNNSLDSLKARNESHDAMGGARPRLDVSTASVALQGKKWARISVYDTGEGIKKSDLKNVLKPFFTTKRPGEGTGLGLTICQQIAHKYGGQLEIDSKEQVWTRVTLSIPYHANV